MDEESSNNTNNNPLLKSLSMDYLNLLINGQAFSDVTFSVEGRIVHAHRCILAARSLFFRKFFSGPNSPPPAAQSPLLGSPRGGQLPVAIPVNSIGYEVFMLMLQFLYSGQVSVLPQKHEPRAGCSERGCWHVHCTAAVDLALDVLAAARAFGVEQLAMIAQKQLASIVEKASIDDVMKVLIASRKQDLQQLWTTCSRLVANSGLPSEILSKHLPLDMVSRIDDLRLTSPLHLHHRHVATLDDHHHKIHRMRRALDSSDVELVKLMVMGEGLNLDDALALHYAVENCSREVVKTLLELGAADVNHPAGPGGRTPLHVAAEMVCPDMVAVLLDHHADPNVRTVDGVTPLDVLRSLTSDFLFKGAVPGLNHVEPNKLRLCLELVQSAAMVMSREEAAVYGKGNHDSATVVAATTMTSLSLDRRMVYLNLGMHGVQQRLDQGREEEGISTSNSTSRVQGSSGSVIGSSSLYSHHDQFP